MPAVRVTRFVNKPSRSAWKLQLVSTRSIFLEYKSCTYSHEKKKVSCYHKMLFLPLNAMLWYFYRWLKNDKILTLAKTHMWSYSHLFSPSLPYQMLASLQLYPWTLLPSRRPWLSSFFASYFPSPTWWDKRQVSGCVLALHFTLFSPFHSPMAHKAARRDLQSAETAKTAELKKWNH